MIQRAWSTEPHWSHWFTLKPTERFFKRRRRCVQKQSARHHTLARTNWSIKIMARSCFEDTLSVLMFTNNSRRRVDAPTWKIWPILPTCFKRLSPLSLKGVRSLQNSSQKHIRNHLIDLPPRVVLGSQPYVKKCISWGVGAQNNARQNTPIFSVCGQNAKHARIMSLVVSLVNLKCFDNSDLHKLESWAFIQLSRQYISVASTRVSMKSDDFGFPSPKYTFFKRTHGESWFDSSLLSVLVLVSTCTHTFRKCLHRKRKSMWFPRNVWS